MAVLPGSLGSAGMNCKPANSVMANRLIAAQRGVVPGRGSLVIARGNNLNRFAKGNLNALSRDEMKRRIAQKRARLINEIRMAPKIDVNGIQVRLQQVKTVQNHKKVNRKKKKKGMSELDEQKIGYYKDIRFFKPANLKVNSQRTDINVDIVGHKKLWDQPMTYQQKLQKQLLDDDEKWNIDLLRPKIDSVVRGTVLNQDKYGVFVEGGGKYYGYLPKNEMYVPEDSTIEKEMEKLQPGAPVEAVYKGPAKGLFPDYYKRTNAYNKTAPDGYPGATFRIFPGHEGFNWGADIMMLSQNKLQRAAAFETVKRALETQEIIWVRPTALRRNGINVTISGSINAFIPMNMTSLPYERWELLSKDTGNSLRENLDVELKKSLLPCQVVDGELDENTNRVYGVILSHKLALSQLLDSIYNYKDKPLIEGVVHHVRNTYAIIEFQSPDKKMPVFGTLNAVNFTLSGVPPDLRYYLQEGQRINALVIERDLQTGKYTLATKYLETERGDMMSPQKREQNIAPRAQEMAEKFRRGEFEEPEPQILSGPVGQMTETGGLTGTTSETPSE